MMDVLMLNIIFRQKLLLIRNFLCVATVHGGWNSYTDTEQCATRNKREMMYSSRM